MSLEYFWDEYHEDTYLKAGIVAFDYWYGDKSYRHFNIVGEIQDLTIEATFEELQDRLDTLSTREYATNHTLFRQGVEEAIRVLKELQAEIQMTQLG